MSSSLSVAVVILSYNGSHHLQQFLPSVLASTYPNIQIVVADNGSTDNTLQLLQTEFPQVAVLINSQNAGFAGGYNWALKQVKADVYVLLNSDVEVTKNWIEPVIAMMESDETIAACQPKLIKYHDQNLFEYAGGAGGFIDFLGYPFSRGRIFDILEKDEGQYNQNLPIFWASGAAMFIRSHVFHELGGFDDFFFAHMEEIDLCWRIHLLGKQVMVCTESTVYHVGAGTLPRGGRKVFLNFRNNLLMLGKNLTWQEKCWKLPLRFALDAISAWKGLLLHGDIAFFAAISKAHFAVLKCWLSGYPSVKLIKKNMCMLPGVHPKSLVWQHFVQQKKKFSQIWCK